MAKQNILNKSKIQKAEKAIKAGKLNDALKILTQLCSRDSADAASWILLASVYGRMNNFQGVGECCMKALALEPDNTAAMNYLGNVYSATKQYDKAIASYKKSLDIKPNDISTLYNLSTLFQLQNNINESLNLLQKIILLKPDHFQALTNLAKIYTDNGKFKLAIENYLALNKIRPHNTEILEQLGSCYSNLMQTNKAREAFQECLKFTDTPAHILIMLSDNEINSNQPDRLEKAGQHLSEALKLDPSYLAVKSAQANLWYKQGHLEKAQKRIKDLINNGYINTNIINTYSEFCHHYDDCDFVIKHGQKLLKNMGAAATEHKTLLNFNLGRVFDKKGNYKEAFKHYQQGNNLEATAYQGKSKSKYMNDIIDAYQADNVMPLKTASLKSDLPIFIVGMPRSGTSLIEQILSSHSDIHGAGELNYISEISNIFIPKKFNIKEGFPAYAKSLTIDQLNTCAQHYLDKLALHSSTALRITDKMPHNFLYLGLIEQLFPQAKIIHCHRTPLDTILSIYFQNFNKIHSYSFRLEDIAHYYMQYQRVMKHWENTLSIEILNVSYCDLVNDFDHTCRNLIDFTGLNWDEQCLHFNKSDRAVATASYDQVRSPIYRSSLDRWKHYEEFLSPLRNTFPDLFI